MTAVQKRQVRSTTLVGRLALYGRHYQRMERLSNTHVNY
jgi:hypothetical protein